jgi:hypothetical protein
MPSSLNLSGLKIYRPGVYSVIDASALGGKGVSTGNVAIVGDFPMFEQSEPLTFTNSKAVSDYYSADTELGLLARLAFSPSNDPQVPGGASTITFQNVRSNTAAFATLLDGANAASVKVLAKVWGKAGKKTLIGTKENATDSNGRDFTVSRDGLTENFTNVQSGVLGNVEYTGTNLNKSVLTASPGNLKLTWEKEFACNGTDTAITHAMSDIANDPTATLSFAITPAGDTDGIYVLTVTGTDADGAAKTANLTMPDSAGADGVTQTLAANGFATITELKVDPAGASTKVFTVSATAFDLSTADFPTVGDAFTQINLNSGKNWKVTVKSPETFSIPLTDLDSSSGANVATEGANGGTAASLRSDLRSVLNALNTSKLITAERSSGATGPPDKAAAFANTPLESGGTEGTSIASTDWETALTKIADKDVQIVVLFTDNATTQKMGIAHARESALFGYERNLWVGAPKDKTLTELFDEHSSVLNTRHMAVVAQEIKIPNLKGTLVFKEPKYLAVMMAGMQAGSSIAMPLTWKRPDVSDVRQDWRENLDAGEAIQKGICVLSRDNLGWKVERSVTTHLEDDNPILSEVSAFESVNTSVRDLRAKLIGQIGNPVIAGTASRMVGAVEARLDKQVKDGIIKAFRNVFIEDLGDTFNVHYEVAAVEPLNFIVVTAHVVRISETT